MSKSHYDSRAALLSGVIDYAGTFPPAKLPLNEALREAAAFRSKAKHPWLMGRMALPVQDILGLSGGQLLAMGADGSPWIFTALGKGLGAKEVATELERLRVQNDKTDGQSCRILVRSYETAALSALFSDQASEGVEKLSKELLEVFEPSIQPYFEIAFGENWIEGLEVLAKVLVEAKTKKHLRPGIKVRTGGKYVPTTEQLGRCLLLCAQNGLRFKATQGLHHAVSKDKEFGFVNLFAALNFAHVLGPENFGKAVVQRCLEDNDVKSFKFGEDKFGWREFEISNAEIESARERHMGCFGSCSLDEPDLFLKQELGS